MQEDADFLENGLINFMLRVVNMDQGYAISDVLKEKYFYESEFQDFQAMTAGLVDVSSSIDNNYTCTEARVIISLSTTCY